VESLSVLEKVTFEALQARLVRQIRLRIHNGEFTERGLSRILGVSQSQTHNVLKGARRLQMPLADRILAKLGLSALDLLSESELDTARQLRMSEWDGPALEHALGDPETDLPAATKKPVAQSGTETVREQRKAG
jgi:plasmid maintenance system antidote protein VapI